MVALIIFNMCNKQCWHIGRIIYNSRYAKTVTFVLYADLPTSTAFAVDLLHLVVESPGKSVNLLQKYSKFLIKSVYFLKNLLHFDLKSTAVLFQGWQACLMALIVIGFCHQKAKFSFLLTLNCSNFAQNVITCIDSFTIRCLLKL